MQTLTERESILFQLFHGRFVLTAYFGYLVLGVLSSLILGGLARIVKCVEQHIERKKENENEHWAVAILDDFLIL